MIQKKIQPSKKLKILKNKSKKITINIDNKDLGEFYTLLLSDGYHDHSEVFSKKNQFEYALTNFFGTITDKKQNHIIENGFYCFKINIHS